MDLLGISDSGEWKSTLCRSISVFGDASKNIDVILSAPATLQVLDVLPKPLSGAVVVMSYNVTQKKTAHSLILLTDTDIHAAQVVIAFWAPDIVAHVNPSHELSSLALCVDAGGYLRYVVVGPLPSPVMSALWLDTSTVGISSNSMARLPLGQHRSIPLELAPPIRAGNSGVSDIGTIEIQCQTLREIFLQALPTQYTQLLNYEDVNGFNRELSHLSRKPNILAALIPPSLGGVVLYLSVQCSIRAAAWAGFSSKRKSDQDPEKKKGFVAVLGEALILLLKEQAGEAIQSYVVPWEDVYGYEALDPLVSSREFHVALVEPLSSIATSLASLAGEFVEVQYKWISIHLSTKWERNSLEYTLRRAHIAATGRESNRIVPAVIATMYPDGRRPYAEMQLPFERDKMKSLIYGRNLKESSTTSSSPSSLSLSLSSSLTLTSSVLTGWESHWAEILPQSSELSHEDAKNMAFHVFPKVLLYYTPVVLLLFDRVIVPSYMKASSCEFDMAELFISSFASLDNLRRQEQDNPQQHPHFQSSSEECGAAETHLVRAAVRAECLLRRLRPNASGPWQVDLVCMTPHGDKPHDNTTREILPFPVVASLTCGEIFLRFIEQRSGAVWEAIPFTHLPRTGKESLLFETHVVPSILATLNASLHIPMAISFVYRCLIEEIEGEGAITLTAQLLYLTLCRVARDALGSSLQFGTIHASAKAFTDVSDWLRKMIAANASSPATLDAWAGLSTTKREEEEEGNKNKAGWSRLWKEGVQIPETDGSELERLAVMWTEKAPALLTACIVSGWGPAPAEERRQLRIDLEDARRQLRDTLRSTACVPLRASEAEAPRPLPVLRYSEVVMPRCCHVCNEETCLTKRSNTENEMEENSPVKETETHGSKPLKDSQLNLDNRNKVEHTVNEKRYVNKRNCSSETCDVLDVSAQTVRTSAQEEDLFRSYMELQTRLRYLEAERDIESKSPPRPSRQTSRNPKSKKNATQPQRQLEEEEEVEASSTAAVPFAYLRVYRAHLQRTAALEQEVELLTQRCRSQEEELCVTRRERDAAIVTAEVAARGPPLEKTYAVFAAEVRRFVVERETHERDRIVFYEAKKRTELLCEMLRLTQLSK